MNKSTKSFKDKILRNSLFLKNITYLSILEGVNILVPIITLPYLLRVLGNETYGLVIFAQAIISFLVLIQNFGLNTLAVKEISIYRNNKERLNEIVNSIMIIKGILFAFLFLSLWVFIQLIAKFKEFEALLYLTMWVCLYDFIFPRWYFQGIENMKYITYLNVVNKTLVVILIFTLIQSPKDYLLLPLINGIGALVAGVTSLIVVYKYHKIRFCFPEMGKLVELIKKSTTFFISDIMVSVFAKSNKVIIGSFLGMTEVAYYDLAEKVILTFKSVPLNIVRDAIYPRVAKTKNLDIIGTISRIMGAYSILIIIALAIFAPVIITLLGGSEMKESINVLRLFSISIFTTHISNYYITVGLWSLGYEKDFRNLMTYSTVVFLIFFGIFWIFQVINIYTITSLPIIVDCYLIIHTYFIYRKKDLLKK